MGPREVFEAPPPPLALYLPEPMPCRCPSDGKWQLQWHLQPTVTAPNRFGNRLPNRRLNRFRGRFRRAFPSNASLGVGTPNYGGGGGEALEGNAGAWNTIVVLRQGGPLGRPQFWFLR